MKWSCCRHLQTVALTRPSMARSSPIRPKAPRIAGTRPGTAKTNATQRRDSKLSRDSKAGNDFAAQKRVVTVECPEGPVYIDEVVQVAVPRYEDQIVEIPEIEVIERIVEV